MAAGRPSAIITMARLVRILKSRTVWTAIATVVVNGVPAIRDSIPASALPVIDGILGMLVIYFRMNPKQQLG